MFFRLTLAALVAATALTPATQAKTFGSNGNGNVSNDDAELIWRGNTGNRSCSLTAGDEGTVSLSADTQWLRSDGSYGTHAELSYVTNGTVGDVFRIKSTDSVVLFENGNDNQLKKGMFNHAEVYLSYNNGGQWHQVWQEGDAVSLTNQEGHIIDGAGDLEVDVKTNGHALENGEVQYGAYIIKNTVVCVVGDS